MELKEITTQTFKQLLYSVSAGSDALIADNLSQLLTSYYVTSEKSTILDVLQDHHFEHIILEFLNRNESDLLLERSLPFLHILPVCRFQDEMQMEVLRIILNLLKRRNISESIIWDCLKILRDFLRVLSSPSIELIFSYDAISTIYLQFLNFSQMDTETNQKGFLVNKKLFGNFFEDFLTPSCSSLVLLDSDSKMLVRDILLKMVSDDEMVFHCQVILQHLYQVNYCVSDSLQEIVLDSGIIEYISNRHISETLLLKVLCFKSWNSCGQMSFFISSLDGLRLIGNMLSNDPNERLFLQCLKFLKRIPIDSSVIHRIIHSDILTTLAKFIVLKNTVSWRYSMETILHLLQEIRKEGSENQFFYIFKSEFLKVIGNSCRTFPEGKSSEMQLVKILEFIFQVGNEDEIFEELREEALAEAFMDYMERKRNSYLNAYMETVCTERNWKLEWRRSFFHKIFVLRQWRKDNAGKSNLHEGIAACHALSNIWKLDSEFARCKINNVIL